MSSQIRQSSPDLDDDVLDWALRALALAQATGAPALACLAGLQQVTATPGAFGLGFAARPGLQQVGLVELAMLADLALGGALRQRVGPTRSLPTLSLTLELAAPLKPDNSSLTAIIDEPSSTSNGVGTVAGTLAEPRAVAGHCIATFTTPSHGEQNELPWDSASSELTVARTPRPTHPSAAEHALARALRAAEAAGRSWGDHLIAQATTTTDTEHVFTPSPAMTNRAGNVQGGVLLAFAAQCGTPEPVPDGETRPWPASATTRFLSGADASTPITALAEVQHATHRTVFAEVRLLQKHKLRAVANLVYRR